MTADHRLATYGSLSPGQSNHHELAGLAGTWSEGTIRGTLAVKAAGVDRGYPALRLDPAGTPIAVALFTSADLGAHWHRLDDFEGDGYRRVMAIVATAQGPVEAFIYVDSGIMAE